MINWSEVSNEFAATTPLNSNQIFLRISAVHEFSGAPSPGFSSSSSSFFSSPQTSHVFLAQSRHSQQLLCEKLKLAFFFVFTITCTDSHTALSLTRTYTHTYTRLQWWFLTNVWEVLSDKLMLTSAASIFLWYFSATAEEERLFSCTAALLSAGRLPCGFHETTAGGSTCMPLSVLSP